MVDNVLVDVLKFMAIAVLVTPLCHRFRVSPILGYLAAGFVAGPNGFALIDDAEGVRLLAEMGVVFLLFVIGLRLSLERLSVIRHYIFGLGTAQVVLTALVLGAIAWAWGLSGEAAVVLGLSLAFSSTAFVLQSLTESGRLNTRIGRVSVAILILQDLAVVPLLVLIPLLGGNGENFLAAIGMAALKAVVGLTVIYLVGRLVLRPLFRVVAATHSSDAFIAAVLLAAVGTAYATSIFGLSLSLGAFLAGIMLASTEYRHQVEADILPIRGLLLGLFFLTIGMTIDLQTAIRHWETFLGGLAVLVAVKAVILLALCRLFRFSLTVSAQIGFLLAQGGEFAFVTLGRAVESGMVVPGLSGQLVTIIAASMALTPLLAAAGDALVRRQEEREADAEGVADLTGHVLIVGFGRVGQTVASVLRRQGIPFVAFDRNPHLVAKFRQRGEPVFFGGAGSLNMMRCLGADRARAAVLTLDNAAASEQVLARLVAEFPGLQVMVRARDRRHQKRLELAGACGVVPETLEGSLQLAGTVLKVLGHPAEDIHGLLDSYRHNNYALIDEIVHPD